MRILYVPIFLALALCSLSAMAARQYSSNKIYFDVSGNVIGQDAYYCNNVHWRGGNISSPYVLTVKGGCGGCMATPTDPCEPNYAIIVTLGGNPPFTTQEACQLVNNSACTDLEPDILTGYGFQVNPV
jgi:hypothetical protein